MMFFKISAVSIFCSSLNEQMKVFIYVSFFCHKLGRADQTHVLKGVGTFSEPLRNSDISGS